MTIAPSAPETFPLSDTLPAHEPDPMRTLGWGVVLWCHTWLIQPDGDRAGEPWRFTDAQIHFLLWFYAVDDDGRWLHNRAAIRRSKGTGKSPFVAALSLAELVGPVRFAGWDSVDDSAGFTFLVGKPVAMPWVQLAATAEAQTTNTMSMVTALAPPGSRVRERYGLDTGKTRVYTPAGGRLEVITASAHAAEGARSTFAVLDEALSLDTVIPTPDGWTTVGDIEVGDTVYGSDGPVTVTHTTPVFTGRPCYRVTFEDGTGLTADEGHLWESKVVGSGAQPKVRTTREMVTDGRRFSVPRPRPFDGPDVPVDLDPYVLGYWLGDGHSAWAGLTVGETDAEETLKRVQNRGVPAAELTRHEDKAATISLRGNAAGDLYTKDGTSVRGALARLGVLNAPETRSQRGVPGYKHIPARLLRGSRRQRLDLLRGLMDSDGWIAENGSVATFVSGNRWLADGVLQLVRTFGWTARVIERVDERWESRPTIYKVSFRPDTDDNPFLLERKASRVREPSARRHKRIVSIVPVESVPVKCIEVDSNDHLFVAGDGWTLTHNTEWWLESNGGHELAKAIRRNLGKMMGRSVETCNAFIPGTDSVAEKTYGAHVMQAEGRTLRKGLLYDSLEAPADTDPKDPVSLRRGLARAYSCAPWVDVEWIVGEYLDPGTPPEMAARFYLNHIVSGEDAWLDPQEWAACGTASRAARDEPPPRPLAEGDLVVLGFDGSIRDDATALVAARIDDGHLTLLGVWERPPDVKDWQVDRVAVDAAVARAMEDYDVAGMFADPAHWQDYLDAWQAEYGELMRVKATGQRPMEYWTGGGHSRRMVLALERFAEAVRERALSHDDHPTLARHVGNARVRATRSGDLIGKPFPSSPDKIDSAMAAVIAYEARNDAIAAGITEDGGMFVPVRVY